MDIYFKYADLSRNEQFEVYEFLLIERKVHFGHLGIKICITTGRISDVMTIPFLINVIPNE